MCVEGELKLTTDSAGDVGSYGGAMRHASGRRLQLRFCNWAERVVGASLYTVEVEILAVKAATLRPKRMLADHAQD